MEDQYWKVKYGDLFPYFQANSLDIHEDNSLAGNHLSYHDNTEFANDYH